MFLHACREIESLYSPPGVSSVAWCQAKLERGDPAVLVSVRVCLPQLYDIQWHALVVYVFRLSWVQVDCEAERDVCEENLPNLPNFWVFKVRLVSC